MKKTIIITGLAVILSLSALIAFVHYTSAEDKNTSEFAVVRKGTFEITVSSPGELIAENSIQIKGPDMVRNRNFRATGIRVTDMVSEGTIVKKGEYIASLDRTFYDNILKDEITKLKDLQAELEMKILDTSVVLNTLRDDIRNQAYSAEEAEIVVEMSKFEPPAVQRKAELELDKAKRYLSWKNRLYYMRKAQVLAEVRNHKRSFDLQLRKVNDLEEVLKEFTVRAPADGMVVYNKDRLGVKIKQGSMLHPFNPVVATLPDLSSLASRVYVSEIEISKVEPGQPVTITIEAFKDKILTGKVASVANIGEQFSNSDSKMFEVLVRFNGSNTALKPTMTTGNRIITRTFNDVIYIPLESLHTGSDSIPYVYLTDGVRQIVMPGESNDTHIIIEQGLKEGSSVYLSIPEKYNRFTLAGNELIAAIKERERSRIAEADKVIEGKELLTLNRLDR